MNKSPNVAGCALEALFAALRAGPLSPVAHNYITGQVKTFFTPMNISTRSIWIYMTYTSGRGALTPYMVLYVYQYMFFSSYIMLLPILIGFSLQLYLQLV